MAKGHAGFISIYENGSWGGGTLRDPQLLTVESDNIRFGKDIKERPSQLYGGRSIPSSLFVDGPEKPQGELTIELKAEDAVKLLMAHFQNGDVDTTYPIYEFIPLNSNLKYTQSDWFSPDGPYGSGVVYSVSVLRKYFNTSSDGGTNSVLFSNGIVDELSFSIGAEETASMTASLKFRDMIVGTAIASNPGTAVGTYSPERKFHYWGGTLLVDGVAFEADYLSLQLKNNLEERSHIGKKNPEMWTLGRHEVTGEIGLDLPKDGIKQIGSMLALKPFSIDFTLANGTNSSVRFIMNNCVRKAFDTTNSNDSTHRLMIPFQAFESSYPSIGIFVTTDYEFGALEQIWDAWPDTRSLSDFEILDAEYGTRVLADYEIADRDL